jgi:hypothetical protein
MTLLSSSGRSLICRVIALCMTALPFYVMQAFGAGSLDEVSGILDSPRFRGKTPLQKLMAAAELTRANRIDQTDISYALLDWADQYLREPSNPAQRLKRWADLTNDDKLSHLKLPRDFLNRVLLAEYLAQHESYCRAQPDKKLEILAKLEQDKLVDWSVGLAYARIYAGGLVMRAREYDKTPPLVGLEILKKLKNDGLVSWHYRAPTEGVLAAEALAQDAQYQNAAPAGKLAKLAEWEKSGLISILTRRELEKLPAWRLLTFDPGFLKADPAAKLARINELRDAGLISPHTGTELSAIFSPTPLASTNEAKPAPLPGKGHPTVK